MGKRYGLVIDLERCIGCHTCRIACKVENGIDVGSGIRVETMGGAHRDTPDGKFPHLSMYYQPVPCMHCDKPPCLDACPLEAIYKREDGVVLVDEGKCDGCQACMAACQYGSFIYNDDRAIVQKCNLCHNRLEEGLEPFCVTCCETEALCFGDSNDSESRASQLIAQRDARCLRPEACTGSAVYYIPMSRPVTV